jgi:undecaprenyl-diphosphatase
MTVRVDPNLATSPAKPAAPEGGGRPLHRRRTFKIVLTAVLVGIVTFWIGWYLVHYVFFNLHEIVPGQVYRSAQPSPEFLERLARDKQLKSVVKFNSVKESDWSRQEEAVARGLGLEFHYIGMGVAELPPKPDMIEMLRVIENAPRPLLLHCKTGADRSGVAAVLVQLHGGMSYKDAVSDQLGLKYLHTGHIGRDIGDFFDQYEDDRKADGKPFGSYADIKSYIVNEYYPDFYHAGYEVTEPVLAGRPGETVTFDVTVTNLTRRPWGGKAFILQMGIPGTGDSPVFPEVLASTFIASRLDPAASVAVKLPVKIPTVAPGRHRYLLDVSELDRSNFIKFGSTPGEVFLDVKAP